MLPRRIVHTLARLVLAGAALPCAAQTPSSPVAAPAAAAPAKPWRVVDTFEVGGNAYVRALTVEPARNMMWVGTSVGVHEVDLDTLKARQTFTRKEGLANEYVFAVGVDAQGYKWFGTNAGGTSRFKDGQWKTYFPMHGLADYWIYAFTSQKDGTLWIGTWAGANKVDLKTMTFTTYVKQLVNEWVYGLGVDSKDRVWFGTEGGVSMFDGKAWKSWTHKDGLGAGNEQNLPFSANTGLGTRTRHDLTISTEGRATYNPNYVFSIHVAPDDSVWAGTWGGGVSRFDGQRWTNLSARDGLVGNIVYSIAQGRDGNYWFGTNKGVSRWDGKTWQSFTRKEGLLEDNVYALAITPKGEVWAGTRRGVTRIAR
jgi:ligand-binding sensor domain-containing protein